MYSQYQMELVSIMEERRFQYEFLHSLFSTPLSKEEIKSLKEQLSLDNMPFNEYLSPFYTELATKDLAEIFEKEEEQFLQLFFGPEHILAPPWESVYRSRERLLFGEPTLKMRKKLREFNLSYENELKEPEDHISIELEFMNYLISQTLMAIEGDDEEKFVKTVNYQFALLDDHLMNWIEPFTKDILAHSTSVLYKGSASLLRDIIKQDYQYLCDIKEVLDHE